MASYPFAKRRKQEEVAPDMQRYAVAWGTLGLRGSAQRVKLPCVNGLVAKAEHPDAWGPALAQGSLDDRGFAAKALVQELGGQGQATVPQHSRTIAQATWIPKLRGQALTHWFPSVHSSSPTLTNPRACSPWLEQMVQVSRGTAKASEAQCAPHPAREEAVLSRRFQEPGRPGSVARRIGVAAQVPSASSPARAVDCLARLGSAQAEEHQGW